MRAFTKDILRTIGHSKKRFISLAAICALGATMLTGLSMACIDLRAAADALYARQHLFDISVQSTLGLTQDDIDELSGIDGVEVAEGGYEGETSTHVDGIRMSVTVKAILASGLNEPYVVEGTLPDAANEVAVTESYLNATGKDIGDTLGFDDVITDDPTGLSELEEEGSDENLLIPGGTYTITAAVIDPTNITQPDGPVAFRASTSTDYTFFVSPEAVVDTSSFTVAYLSVAGTEGLSAYSDAYNDRVDTVRERVEDIAPQRERARTQSIQDDARESVAESEAEAHRELADAEQELVDGQATIDESLAEALAGKRELGSREATARAELASAQQTIDDNRAILDEGASELALGIAAYNEGVRTYNQELPAATQSLRDGQTALDAARDEFYGTTLAGLETQRDQLQGLTATLPAQISQIDGQISQLADGIAAMAQAPELTEVPSGQALAAMLQRQSEHIESTWDAVCAVDARDDEAVTQVAGDFAQAIDDAAKLVSTLQPTLDTAAERLSGAIDQAQAELEQLQASLDLCEQAVDAATADVDRLEQHLASLDDGEPARADVEKDLADAAAALTEATDERDAAQDACAAAEGRLDALGEQRAQIETYLDGMQAIIELADPENPQSADTVARSRIEAAAGLAQAQAGLAELEAGIESATERAEATFASQQQLIDDGWAELRDAYSQLVAAKRTLDASARELDAGRRELDAGQQELSARRASALAQIADARAQIENGLQELADTQTELDEGCGTFERERADALAQIDEAYQTIDDVEPATWYVQDRTGMGSFTSVDSDASSIEAIARIIPIIFFVVAILVSLTTATRMVEEERGLIGLYKALGYSKAAIRSKYLVYTIAAALIGGLIGNVAGFVVIPYILLSIFQAMYLLPLFSLQFSLAHFIGAIAVFIAGIAGSTFITCQNDLRETPASLMRPRAPRAGSRILLERVRPIWRRMSFLNKVTARNLFRYKKRLLMTIFGIMGCTALLICGFSVKNTVESLAPRQYEQIYRYDLMAATTTDDYSQAFEVLSSSPEVTDLDSIGVDNITVEYGDGKESMQIYVIPDGVSIASYVSLETLDGAPIDLDEAGVVITNNAATVLGLDAGDTIGITTSTLDKAQTTVSAITRNYLGNSVYMTQDVYEDLFGPLELNGFFAHLAGTNEEQSAFADDLEANDLFMSITSVAKMREQFEKSFTLINVVVYVVIGLAAGLAFVVLFTLSTVNIGEREREIATIKVLGFRTGEVRTYINKETFILTLLGILVGLPAGWALSESFTYILKMPSIFFDVEVGLWCYALAAAFSAVFALAVSKITDRMLDRIDMVEALKSPE